VDNVSVLTGESIRAAVLSGDLEVSVEIDGQLTKVGSSDAIDAHLGLGPAKMDVHLGSEYLLYSEAPGRPLGSVTHPLKEGQIVSLRPGGGLVARSREYLKVPRDLCGIVSSKVGFVTVGLSPVSATLDPGFEGYLIVSLWNLGGLVVNLGYGDPLASLTLFKTDRPVASGSRTRAHSGDLRTIMASDVLADYLSRGKPTLSSFSIDALLTELGEAGAWSGSAFQQLAHELKKVQDRLASIEDRQTEFSVELDNRAFPPRATSPGDRAEGSPSERKK
jgi:deoxycytidine triphosphate deaminase